MRFDRRDSSKLALALVAALIWAGCTDREAVTDPETGQPAGIPPVNDIVAALSCTADVKAERLTCEAPDRLRGVLDPRFLIVGGQGVYVTLSSFGVTYDGTTFSAFVQVENLIDQVLGYSPTSEESGVKVFFHTGPTVTGGTGSVNVSNEDGTGTFTASNQPYHFYDELLTSPDFAPSNVSTAKNWQWSVPPTVESFEFEVFVQAPVRGENGYVEVTPTKAFLSLTETQTIVADVLTAVGNPKAGTATFSTSDPSVATVNSTTGLVTAVDYGRAEITATTGGPEADGVAVITVDQPVGYQIEIVFPFGIGGSQAALASAQTVETAFANAAARWESIITADLQPVNTTSGGLPVCAGVPVDEYVDDLVIQAVVAPIDGVGGILGQAGPCAIRSSNGLPFYGAMIFDSDDLADLEADGQLEDVILHEMGHVLGYGTLWQLPTFDLLRDEGDVLPDCDTPDLTDPYFTGALANTAFDDAGGTTYVGNTVPVEDTGGGGTRCGHWREVVFETELMTGFISAPGTANPLSAISIQSLADMGYTVDTGPADAYTLPSPALGPQTVSGRRLGNDIWRGAVYTVDERGKMVQILPDRRPDWLKRWDVSPSR